MGNIIPTNRGLEIKSTELVSIINNFRVEEHRGELRHDDFIKKIRKEIEILESAGIKGVGNFSESSYINSQNKTQPCYSLNRDGMLQMLNSESALVRYKTIEYINELEKELEKPKLLSPTELLDLQLQVMKDQEEKIIKIDTRLTTFIDNSTLSSGQVDKVNRRYRAYVVKLLGGKDSLAYKDTSLRSKVYSNLQRDIREYFKVENYKDILAKDLDKVLIFIDKWKPEHYLQMAITGYNNSQIMLEVACSRA